MGNQDTSATWTADETATNIDMPSHPSSNSGSSHRQSSEFCVVYIRRRRTFCGGYAVIGIRTPWLHELYIGNSQLQTQDVASHYRPSFCLSIRILLHLRPRPGRPLARIQEFNRAADEFRPQSVFPIDQRQGWCSGSSVSRVVRSRVSILEKVLQSRRLPREWIFARRVSEV